MMDFEMPIIILPEDLDRNESESASTNFDGVIQARFNPIRDVGDNKQNISKEEFVALYGSDETQQAGPVNGLGSFSIDLDPRAPDTMDTTVRVHKDEDGYILQGTDEAIALAEKIISSVTEGDSGAGVEDATSDTPEASPPAEPLVLSLEDLAALRKSGVIDEGRDVLMTPEADVRYAIEGNNPLSGQTFVIDGQGNIDASKEANPNNTASASEIESYLQEQVDDLSAQ